MEELLQENLLVSTGCTEPIAIAYASAIARRYLEEEPSKIFLRISKNMAKNAMDAGIPNSDYVGAAFVSALGALFGDSTKGFQLLEGLSKQQHDEAYKFAKENLQIEIADTDKALYIEVRMDGVELKFEPEAIDLIASEAIKRKTGARALRSIVEEIMMDIMYALPSQENVKEFTVTADMVKKKSEGNGEVIKLPTKNEEGKPEILQPKLKATEEIA